MLREWCVNPEHRDVVGYFCNNPACRYHHKGEFEYVVSRASAGKAAITRYDDR